MYGTVDEERVDWEVRFMQSAQYFLRLMMNLLGRTYGVDSRIVMHFLSISWMCYSALWQ